MRVRELNNISAMGHIKAEFVGNGLTIPLVSRDNVITYSGADIMARILGNDTEYVPKHIGFMYGASATAPTLVDPNLLPEATRRVHPWTTITADVEDATANILVTPLILNAGFASSSSVYTGNVATVAAFTGTRFEYAFPITGGTYAPELQDGFYFYQAIFLNRRVINNNIIYTPFSRVTLRNDGGTYDAKPAGFELSLYWTITFN
jgi:hypothetical protein